MNGYGWISYRLFLPNTKASLSSASCRAQLLSDSWLVTDADEKLQRLYRLSSRITDAEISFVEAESFTKINRDTQASSGARLLI